MKSIINDSIFVQVLDFPIAVSSSVHFLYMTTQAFDLFAELPLAAEAAALTPALETRDFNLLVASVLEVCFRVAGKIRKLSENNELV